MKDTRQITGACDTGKHADCKPNIAFIAAGGCECDCHHEEHEPKHDALPEGAECTFSLTDTLDRRLAGVLWNDRTVSFGIVYGPRHPLGLTGAHVTLGVAVFSFDDHRLTHLATWLDHVARRHGMP